MNSRPKTTKPHPGAKRRRAIYLPLLLALPVLGGLLWFCSRIETEPMTSDEMLAKEHWTAEQLAAAMTRENGRLKATLWSDRDYGDVSVRCGGGMRKIALKALQEVDVEFPLPDDEPLVTLELTGENGRKIAALTRSFDEKHRPEPAAEKNKIFAYAPAYAEFFTDFS